MSPTLELAIELIRRPSITPSDAGCQALIAERLAAAGFGVEPMRFGEVENLWARRGAAGPLLVFLGHTDVVAPGPPEHWRTPPFEPVVRDARLHGRGAADMKGGVAAFVTACERFCREHPTHRGSLAVLLTSDEEGPARDGTRRVIEHLAARAERIDWCLVGEPSSRERVGDVVRIGRRGSLGGRITVKGIQGHVAYPETALNPIHGFAAAFAELAHTHWDDGNRHFPPTGFQTSNVRAGTGADNVIPDRLEAWFNFRYSTESTVETLRDRVEAVLDRHGIEREIEWSASARPFLTEGGALVEAVRATIAERTGLDPELSTGGGTSDGRFVAPTGAEVVELGLVNATVHQVNEQVRAADLDTLSAIYEGMIERLLG